MGKGTLQLLSEMYSFAFSFTIVILFSSTVSSSLLLGVNRTTSVSSCSSLCLCHALKRAVANCSGANIDVSLPLMYPTWVRTLILDDNLLGALPPELIDASVNASELETLSLRRCNLSEISEKTFARMSGLKELRLDHNHIVNLPENLFDHVINLQVCAICVYYCIISTHLISSEEISGTPPPPLPSPFIVDTPSNFICC